MTSRVRLETVGRDVQRVDECGGLWLLCRRRARPAAARALRPSPVRESPVPGPACCGRGPQKSRDLHPRDQPAGAHRIYLLAFAVSTPHRSGSALSARRSCPTSLTSTARANKGARLQQPSNDISALLLMGYETKSTAPEGPAFQISAQECPWEWKVFTHKW